MSAVTNPKSPTTPTALTGEGPHSPTPRPIRQPAIPTIDTTWLAASGRPVNDELLSWPPDMLAFTHVILDRAEAYRFAVSPPTGSDWPPSEASLWDQAVTDAARQWCRRTDDGLSPMPELVQSEWEVVRNASATSLNDLSSGRAWRLCVALLTLHAIADEVCAGVGVRAGRREPIGISLRAQMRELLARSGSMARIVPDRLRVLPKYRTSGVGITSRSISRYTCVVGPSVEFEVRGVAGRCAACEQGQLNLLLLPWPLRIEDDDFRPLAGSVRERPVEPYGFFEYRPSDDFDLGLVDRVLRAARQEAGHIDVVVLPESSLLEEDLDELEETLALHDVDMLIAGVRSGSDDPSGGSNWVHIGSRFASHWARVRQDKHHRWSMDSSQIAQYHLEHVLDPRLRWWEAMPVQPRSLQLVERGDGQAIASLVCEDLARIDEVTNLLRAVGPNLVVSLLLDGPQLATRWTARYAAALVDDPGSAVLTLSSFGMVHRTWSGSHEPSSIVALWKDAVGRSVEIPLDQGAQGIVLTTDWRPAIRRAADGRSPANNALDLTLSRVTQVRAVEADSRVSPIAKSDARTEVLDPTELTILLSWANAVAEALEVSPVRLERVLADAQTGAAWRVCQDVPEPVGVLADSLGALTTCAHRDWASNDTFGGSGGGKECMSGPSDRAAPNHLADAALSAMVGPRRET